MENIFADFGNVISSGRYISRSKVENDIKSRLLDNDTYGSTGLVGLQRMGKSSLAYNLFESKASSLLEDKIMVIKLVMYTYKTPQAFFEDMASRVFDILEDRNEMSAKLERRYKRIQESSVEDNGGERVRSFFKLVVSEMGYRVICIIDEFDYSKKLFAEYPEGFFVLRELAYQPENKIGFLFLSRHFMAELEAGVGFDVSNFSNILHNTCLTVYTDDEFCNYFSNFESMGVEVTEQMKEEYKEITGKIPYWMDILSFHYINSIQNGENKSLYEIFDDNQDAFYGEFQRFFTLLKDQNLLNTLYQVVLGPVGDDATPKQIRRLKDYGLIEGAEDTGYKTISKYFRQFMVMKEQTVEFYPLWNRTEKLLRQVGAERLRRKYGDNWEEELVKVHVKPDDSASGHATYRTVGDYILAAKSRIEDMKNRTELYEIDPAQLTLLDGTTTGGLAAILCEEYAGCFKDVFQMNKKDFRRLIEDITSARNPYGHNNDQFIRDDVKQRINENCLKLVKLMDAYLN